MTNVHNNLLSSANNITTGTNNMVNYYKLKHKKVNVQKVVVDIKREIESVVDFQKVISSVEENNVDIKINFDENVPKDVEVDIAIFQEIMSKLVSNSIKYNTKKPGSVTINCSYEDGKLFISIKDTGCGMSKSKIKEIFDPFTHLYCSKKNEKPSGSLGLLISKELSNILEGNLSLTSDGKGKGTTSHMIIPMLLPKKKIVEEELPDEEEEEEEKEEEKGKDTIKNKNDVSILIIDDSVVISKLLKLWLRKMNFQKIKDIQDGKKAIEEIQKNPNEYDIIFLDFYLGTEMNAFDILKHLDNSKNTKVVLVTGAVFNDFETERIKEFQSLIGGRVIKKPLYRDKFQSMFTSHFSFVQ